MNSCKKKNNLFRNFYLCNDQGELVGSAGLWQGNHFGQNRLRVHYVAVSESAQHQGIASAMVSKLIAMYDQIPSKYPLYLATQTNSYGAIAMYSHLGFTPYLGAWRDCSEAQSKDNWELATEILRKDKGLAFVFCFGSLVLTLLRNCCMISRKLNRVLKRRMPYA